MKYFQSKLDLNEEVLNNIETDRDQTPDTKNYGLRFEISKEENTENNASPIVLPKGKPTESDLTPESSLQQTPALK